MRIPQYLIGQKAVGYELGISLAKLSRLRNCGLKGIPEPVRIRNMLFWQRSDIPKLEDAIWRFPGRCAFE